MTTAKWAMASGAATLLGLTGLNLLLTYVLLQPPGRDLALLTAFQVLREDHTR